MTASVVTGLLDSLAAETSELLSLVAELTEAQAQTQTPAPGWSIQDQIGHLWLFDRVSMLALETPTLFGLLKAAAAQSRTWVDDLQADSRRRSWADLLATFTDERDHLAAVVRRIPERQRVPWFGPDMSLASFVSARIMETWAHGQDCADALGVAHRPTTALRHVCDLGYRTIGFSFANRGLEPPKGAFRVELVAPDGQAWTWGDEGAPNRVTGTAWGFAHLVTRRRSARDSGLVAHGPDAPTWLEIAQCYAGDAGAGRRDGQFDSAEAK